MFKPPHWFYKNTKFPEKEIDQVINKLKQKLAEEVIENNPLLTSFFLTQFQRPDKIWNEKYSELMEGVVKQLGVYTTCRYNYEYWSQYYQKDIGHYCHHHARGNLNAFGQLSWVHFLRTTGNKPFVFLDRTGNTYTPKQDQGDLLIFPSCIWHEVKPNTTNDKRFVVAGNLWITDLETL
jgi:hypothetical protein